VYLINKNKYSLVQAYSPDGTSNKPAIFMMTSAQPPDESNFCYLLFLSVFNKYSLVIY